MATTTTQEYFSNLSLLHNVNAPAYALLSSANNIYNIDLNTRKIDAPKVLSVEKDHKSEVVYFSVDRFADYMDLANTCCIIQYNVERKIDGKPVKKSYYYPVPFFDIYSKAKEQKIIFPWCLDTSVTATSGYVEFSIQFFKTGTHIKDNGEAELIYTYNLRTLPAQSEVVKGIFDHEITNADELLLVQEQYNKLWGAISALEEGIATQLYWTILPDDFTVPEVDDSEIKQEMTTIQDGIEENIEELKDSSLPINW